MFRIETELYTGVPNNQSLRNEWVLDKQMTLNFSDMKMELNFNPDTFKLSEKSLNIYSCFKYIFLVPDYKLCMLTM